MASMQHWGTTESERHAGELKRLITEAAWNASREERGARFHNRGPCLTRHIPYGEADPYGHRLHEVCRQGGCLDLMHDLFARIEAKLVKMGPRRMDDPGAYLYTMARTELIDLKREERSAAGFPTRPLRKDGVGARVDEALAACADTEGPWLVTLFRIMRSYPFSTNHVPGRWPIDGLRQERRTLLPDEEPTASLVRSEINWVLRVAKHVAGEAWVYSNITLPLQAHGNQQELSDNHPSRAVDDIDILLGNLLADAYQSHRRRGLSQDKAIRLAVQEVLGAPAPHPTKELREALLDLESQGGAA